MLLAMGDTDAAVERLRRAVELSPSNAGACNDLAWFLAESESELDEALALARRAARLSRSANALDTLGWVQLKRGNPELAASAFRRALAQSDTSPSLRYRLGLALSRAGKMEEAAVELRGALAAGSFPEADAARSELARIAQPRG